MKINKRVLSICLAVMLVVAMAIPASAATDYREGSYEGATYATSCSCYTNRWSCIIEISSSDNDSNYLLYIDVQPYMINKDGSYSAMVPNYGSSSTSLSGNSLTVAYPLGYIWYESYINHDCVNYGTVYAN